MPVPVYHSETDTITLILMPPTVAVLWLVFTFNLNRSLRGPISAATRGRLLRLSVSICLAGYWMYATWGFPLYRYWLVVYPLEITFLSLFVVGATVLNIRSWWGAWNGFLTKDHTGWQSMIWVGRPKMVLQWLVFLWAATCLVGSVVVLLRNALRPG